MAKKFAHIKSISDVFDYENIDSKKVYNPSSIKHSDINHNTLCFVYVDEDSSDIGSYIDDYEIKAKDRYIICQGSIFAYVGKKEIPEDPGTEPENPEENVWRPIFINNNLIENLEFEVDGDIIHPIADYSLNFTTKQTNLEGEGFDILNIEPAYNANTGTVSAFFGIDSDELKAFIEKVLPPSPPEPGNGLLTINVDCQPYANFNANQNENTNVNFVKGDNISLSTDENGIKISAIIPDIEIPETEEPKDGKLSFILDEEDSETGEITHATIGSFSANQEKNTTIKFLAGDNIKISINEDTDENTEENTNSSIKISAIIPEIEIPEPEKPKDGVLSFTLDYKNPETGETSYTTIGQFTANQERSTNISFLAGDNIILEGTNGQLKISGSEQRTYTTADIMFANEIKIGGTKLGDIIAAENIFPDDKITTDMSLQFVLETILSGISTSEEWGIQEVLAELKPADKTKILITAKNYYTGEEIDLNKPLIELEADTTILVTYTIEDPKVYQTVKVSPFVGGYALENTDPELEDAPLEPVALMSEDEVSPDTPLEPGETVEPVDPENPEIDMDQDNPTIPMYKEFIGDTEYLRIFDGATYTFDDYQNPSFDGFTKVSASDIGNNEIVLKVNEGWNNLSIKRSWSITPELNFDPYYIYPISNRGNIGLDRGIEISNSLFFDLAKIGTLESKLQIRGVSKELLPYYIGIVNNFENIFDFSDGQEISSESLVSNTEKGIRIEKQETEAPSVITPTTQTDDLQLFIAVPVNQFNSTDWLVSVVNTVTSENITDIDSIYLVAKKLSVTIDSKPYYLWSLSGTDAYSTFGADMYKITLNK
jgi:hypothetical protein